MNLKPNELIKLIKLRYVLSENGENWEKRLEDIFKKILTNNPVLRCSIICQIL